MFYLMSILNRMGATDIAIYIFLSSILFKVIFKMFSNVIRIIFSLLIPIVLLFIAHSYFFK